jgi:predicted nucleic acid-binding protein
MQEQPEDVMFLSVLSLGEVMAGIHRLAQGRRKKQLSDWLEQVLKPWFEDRCLVVDEEIAERWGVLHADAIRAGRTMPVIDGLIAATAIIHGLTLVTRNERNFRGSGVSIFNPWTRL